MRAAGIRALTVLNRRRNNQDQNRYSAGLHLRSEPNMSGAVKTALRKGDQVELPISHAETTRDLRKSRGAT
jgi:hypothetical protein